MKTLVKNKIELFSIIEENKLQIKNYGVIQIGVFGSFVRNQMSENSDVDFYVDFELKYKTLKNFVGLANYLQSLLGRKVEIITRQSLNAFTGKYILKEVEFFSIEN